MKSKLLILLLALSFCFAACNKENKPTENNNNEANTENKTELSEQNPILVDKDAKTVTIYATLNGKYIDGGTRHAIVSSSGKVSDKSMFVTPVTPENFYKALEEIGAKPGNNVTADNAKETKVEGSSFDIKIITDGKEYGIDEAIKDSNGNPIKMKFGGNLDNAKEYNTGCIACLDSCYVGIVSNSEYLLSDAEQNKVNFTCNKDILKNDGQVVEIKFILQE